MCMCKYKPMPTNLAIDDNLLGEAQKVGGHRTKKDTVNEASREYKKRRRQAIVLELFGKMDDDCDAKYDRKKLRRRT
jgi:Arc/MetJ family transcription regulator